MEVSWKAFGIFVQAKSFLMVYQWVSHEGMVKGWAFGTYWLIQRTTIYHIFQNARN